MNNGFVDFATTLLKVDFTSERLAHQRLREIAFVGFQVFNCAGLPVFDKYTNLT